MNKTNNLNFEFDAVDKRRDQLPSNITANDVLLHAAMLNEYGLFKNFPKGYRPSQEGLMGAAMLKTAKATRAALARLEEVGLIKKLSGAQGHRSQYIVYAFDEVDNLLVGPSRKERREEAIRLRSGSVDGSQRPTQVGREDLSRWVPATYPDGSQRPILKNSIITKKESFKEETSKSKDFLSGYGNVFNQVEDNIDDVIVNESLERNSEKEVEESDLEVNSKKSVKQSFKDDGENGIVTNTVNGEIKKTAPTVDDKGLPYSDTNKRYRKTSNTDDMPEFDFDDVPF
ncbi:hypothetical protein R0595_001289 [Pluralibacter gergoviae]|nr:hypothetical protein [Pluralibacter gergoviae]ELW9440305.1 hypothetical protein [Pluralibacter gergoviae]